MKKAIIVIAHKCPEQINMFLKQLLLDQENDIYVHINKLCEHIIPEIMKSDRIFINKNNIVINWATDGLLRAILLMYREIISTKKHYEYIIVCSGQDLLVRNGLNDFLEQSNGQIFMNTRLDNQHFAKAKLLYVWPEIFLRKYDFYFHPVRIVRAVRFMFLRMFGIGRRKKIRLNADNITFYYDNFWHAIPYVAAKYIIDFLEENPEFFDIYLNAFAPDESFFSTVLMMSPFKDKIALNNGHAKSLTYIKTVINHHPAILSMKDIPNIEASCMFFARKFDLDQDKSVVNYFVEFVKK